MLLGIFLSISFQRLFFSLDPEIHFPTFGNPFLFFKFWRRAWIFQSGISAIIL
jgi:hypothetical protein